MNLKETALQAIFDEREFFVFKQTVREVAQEYPEIVGIMSIGSMCQRLRVPFPFQPRADNPKMIAYDLIRNPLRRRTFPSINSDLDLWVCTQDEPEFTDIETKITQAAIPLIDWLAEHPGKHFTEEWVDLKKEAFDKFYKQDNLYSSSWNFRNNGEPWMAHNFKTNLVNALQSRMPDTVQRINSAFTKKVEDGFFEVRAYPVSAFNLRPEDIVVDGKLDRSPFPRVVNPDWLDLRHNVFVLFDSRKQNLIYPFDPNGKKLGGGLWRYIT